MKRSLMADEYATLKKSKTINLHFERQIVVEGESEVSAPFYRRKAFSLREFVSFNARNDCFTTKM